MAQIRPTPTQGENDLQAQGQPVILKSPDGSPSDPGMPQSPPVNPEPPGVPFIASITPTTHVKPSSPVTVNGAGFTASSVVRCGGVAQTTTFVNATQVTATLAGFATAGDYDVLVREAGKDSNVVRFTFTNT